MKAPSLSRADAVREGRVRYLGSPCRTCGGTERYTGNGGCCRCTGSKSSERNKAVRDALRQAKEREAEG